MHSDITNYRYIPDLCLKVHGMILPIRRYGDVDIDFLNRIRYQYHEVGNWLEFYFCDYRDLHPSNNTYKPFAEKSRGLLQLAQEVFLLSPDTQVYFGNPINLWFGAEMSRCIGLLAKSGFTDEPIPKSKANHVKELGNIHQKYSDPEKLPTLEKNYFCKNPHDFLMNEAVLLAKVKGNTKFRTHWRRYLTIVKQSEDTIRRSDLKPHYLYNGQIVTGKSITNSKRVRL